MIEVSLYLAGLQLLYLGAIGCGVVIFTAPLQTAVSRFRRSQLELQIITGCLGVFSLLFNFLYWYANDIANLNQLTLIIPNTVALAAVTIMTVRRLMLWWPLRHSRFASHNSGKNRVE